VNKEVNNSENATQAYDEVDNNNQTQFYPEDVVTKPQPQASSRPSLTRSLSKNRSFLMNSDDMPTQTYLDEEAPQQMRQSSDLLDLYNEAHEESPDIVQPKNTAAALPSVTEKPKDDDSGDETDEGESKLKIQNTQPVEDSTEKPKESSPAKDLSDGWTSKKKKLGNNL
jgi:hypothetical protein